MKIFKTKISKLNEEEFKTLIKKHLYRINNLELIILKGHLLIEFLLNKFLETHSDDENFDITKTNFQFSQKIKICKMFEIFYSKSDFILEQTIILNKIRNTVAHRLEIDSKLLNELKKYYLNSKEINSDKEMTKFLKFVVQNICYQLIGRFNAQITIENEFRNRALK